MYLGGKESPLLAVFFKDGSIVASRLLIIDENIGFDNLMHYQL